MYQDSLDSILDHDPLPCKDSDTNLVAQLKHQLAESQHTIASLQADVQRLASENTSLNTTCQALQNIIVNIRGSASSVASSSSLSVTSSTSSGTNSNDEHKPPLLLNGTIEEACDHELNQTEFLSVESWIKKGWQEQYPPSTSAVPDSSSKKSAHGSRQMAQGINVSTYLQDKDSMPVSAQRAKSIRLTMLSCFCQLHTQGLAPELIGQASLDVLKWLVHTLRKTHFELQLCADNWKIMKLMTDNYPQWHKYHTKKRSSNHVKAEQDLEDKSITDLVPIATQKRRSSEPDNEYAIKEEVDLTASSTNDIIQDSSPNHEPTPPPSTDKGKAKEVITVEIKNPLSNLAPKPQPRPIPLEIPATSTSTSELNLTPIPSTNNITQHTLISMPEVPSTADSTSLDVKMKVIAASQSAKQMKITINSSKPDTIKKRQLSTKPMHVSAKITARNLCALDWQSNGHQKEPATVFASYWNGLSKADKDVYTYKCKATAQLKSCGVVGTIRDVDKE
ncbi:uncharacterized protein F5891DRAFT_1190772 [Suillus fuscotomentosus]|uniref:Uncharacterized protein n=1 Tax=Suillus fuscotomentosus TaxID=1912939 RepID=A0AAD4E2B9_9AGAM|nr:uncharacterized protein F5891DRAFT_1190772 [Suillus fuscotomentosus]KAG1898401.1 hypothetical protein F5891DRAFT_1190772 [Suillus fuscotomentosus]